MENNTKGVSYADLGMAAALGERKVVLITKAKGRMGASKEQSYCKATGKD